MVFSTDDVHAFVNYLYVLKEGEVEEDDFEAEAQAPRGIATGLKAPDKRAREKFERLAASHDYFCSEYFPVVSTSG